MSNRSSDSKEEPIIIVQLWDFVIKFLSRISFFDMIMRYMIKPRNWPNKKTYIFVDLWVLGHTLLSFLAILTVWYIDHTIVEYSIIIYGLLRVFEIVIYQLKVILIDSYQPNATVRSFRRSVICLLHNFIEIIFWFTASYLFFSVYSDSLSSAIYKSFIIMTSFSASNEVSGAALYLIAAQSMAGLLMTILSLARFVSLLPRPESGEKAEQGKN